MVKLTKHDKMYSEIQKHGEKLNVIFETGLEPITLCKKLRHLEAQAHKLTEEMANTGEDHEEKLTVILAKVKRVLYDYTGEADYNIPLYDALFINQDPRGYALKIDDQYMRDHNLDLHRDWGGYGILAPDFS